MLGGSAELAGTVRGWVRAAFARERVRVPGTFRDSPMIRAEPPRIPQPRRFAARGIRAGRAGLPKLG